MLIETNKTELKFFLILTNKRAILNTNHLSPNFGELVPLQPKSSRSSIMITKNCAYRNHEYQPGSKLPKYHHAYMNTDLCKDLFLSKYAYSFGELA